MSWGMTSFRLEHRPSHQRTWLARAGDFDDLEVGDIIEVTATEGVDMPADYGTPYRVSG